jgi:hypothetical protein
MEDKELIKVIYQGDLVEFLKLSSDKRILRAYENASYDYNERIKKFFKDLTRRVTNPAYLEMLLCDLYGIMTLYEYFAMLEGDYEFKK